MCKHNRKIYGLRSWNRHSWILVAAGLTYIAIGATYVQSDVTVAAITYAAQWLPMWAWGWLWIFVGLLALIDARWPPYAFRWGYGALTGLTVAWALFYVIGVIFGEAPYYQIRGALGWGLMGFVWWGAGGLVAVPKISGKAVHHACCKESLASLSQDNSS